MWVWNEPVVGRVEVVGERDTDIVGVEVKGPPEGGWGNGSEGPP